MNPAMFELSRAERRQYLKAEEKNRASGDWGPWEKLDITPGTIGRTWAREFTVAHKNRVFCVLERVVQGGVRHLAVTSGSCIRPTWYEMQRIKDELAGAEATAVEVYPPRSEIVDGADMFHIWVLTEPLPFGLCEG